MARASFRTYADRCESSIATPRGPRYHSSMARSLGAAEEWGRVIAGLAVAIAAIATIASTGARTDTAVPDPRMSFEWTLAAPVVVGGTSLGQDGRQFDVVVTKVLRGDLRVGEPIRVDVREANRERDRMLDPKAQRLDAGASYVLLLEPLPATDGDAEKSRRFGLVRGVDGVFALPAEGRDALLAAFERFIAIQDARSEAVKWSALDEMLGETNPLLLAAALDQFLKFRRGTAAQAPALPPLLDHPQSEIRAQAARLAGQILDRTAPTGEPLPDEEELRLALVARARRDPTISVRIAATQAIGSLGDAAAEAVLREIAASDPEQAVRYAAEVLLLDHAATRAPASPGEGGPR